MWQLIFDYSGLESPEKIYNIIRKHSDEFDWSWPDADRARNFNALQKVIYEEVELKTQLNVHLWKITLESGETVRSVFYYDNRLCSYVDLYPENIGAENYFDFQSPVDVLNVLNEFELKALEMLKFYQIKTA